MQNNSDAWNEQFPDLGQFIKVHSAPASLINFPCGQTADQSLTQEMPDDDSAPASLMNFPCGQTADKCSTQETTDDGASSASATSRSRRSSTSSQSSQGEMTDQAQWEMDASGGWKLSDYWTKRETKIWRDLLKDHARRISRGKHSKWDKAAAYTSLTGMAAFYDNYIKEKTDANESYPWPLPYDAKMMRGRAELLKKIMADSSSRYYSPDTKCIPADAREIPRTEASEEGSVVATETEK